MPERILSFEAALAEVLTHVASLAVPGAKQTVELLDAAGRTLAQAVFADRDQPPFDRSTRDGFALRADEVAQPMRLMGSVRAGEVWAGAALAAGEAVEIMTGAPLPAGADAVLMVEHAELADDVVQAHAGRSLRAGDNVVARGAEARAGQTVLPRGRLIGAAEIAVAASCGCTSLEVFAQPSVAILSTGDELVELAQEPAAHQIRNSNSYALAALVAEAGGAPQRLPIVRDTREDLRAHIAEGLAHDLLLMTGGVSAGKYDFVEEVLAEFGAEFFFTGALIQPGKPIVFGQLGRPGGYTYFFGLPGNPISAQVCFHLFVAPLLRALCGRSGELPPLFVEARLAEDVKGGSPITRFLPAELTSDSSQATVRPTRWQGSGDLAANARGNCYVVLPADAPSFSAGATVRVLLR